jgi:hypothetical protein
MNWNKKIPLFLFLLITAGVSGVIFVLASEGDQLLTPLVSDTASFTEEIASLLTGGLTPLVSDTASFTEEIASLLTGGLTPLVSDTASFTDSR